jgi:phage virion morphogenesis protein
MAELTDQFETWARAIVDRLSPAARRTLNRDIARALRRSQQQRIAAQQSPDGSAFEPRRLRRKAGRIKRRKMYAKLKTAKHMKTVATADAALVRFTGRDAHIARVAQYGLTDAVRPGGVRVRYPQRELLGFSEADKEMIRDLLMAHLEAATPS